MIMSPEELASAVREIVVEAGPFKPLAYYDKGGDCIEFVSRPDPFCAQRVSDRITLYVSDETGDVVGCLLKGIGSLMSRGQAASLKSGSKVKVVYLIAIAASAEDIASPGQGEVPVSVYTKLIRAAEEADAEADLEPACV